MHRIRSSFHIADVERRAEALLIDARIAGELPRPTNYRIRDPLGRCVRSSAGAKPVSTFRRAGRTCWA